MILNRQRRVPVSLRSLERFWLRARAALRLPPDAVTVCLVGEAAMARWNRAYRGKPGPTDVLSFPAGDDPAPPPPRKRNRARAPSTSAPPPVEPGRYLGDVAIAPAVARRNARRFGRTLPQELRILILHGALHLLGYDHETDRGEMERLERRLRRRLGLDPR